MNSYHYFNYHENTMNNKYIIHIAWCKSQEWMARDKASKLAAMIRPLEPSLVVSGVSF